MAVKRGTNSTGCQGNIFNPTGGTLTFTPAADGTPNGQFSLDAAGNFSYTPNSGFNGSNNFSYVISDGSKQTTGTVTSNVDALAANDANYATPRDQPLTGNLTEDVTASSDSTLTFTPANSITAQGQVTVDAAGNFVYTPYPGYDGPDNFTYTVSDGSYQTTGTVNILVDGLTANTAAYSTLHDQPLSANLQGNIFNPTGGTLNFTSTNDFTANGQVLVNADGSFVYTPTAAYRGADSFTYTVSDGNLETTGIVNVTVVGLTTRTATFVVSADQPVAVDLQDYVSNPVGGALSYQMSGASANQAGLSFNGSVANLPNPGPGGVTQFTYTVSDGSDEATGTATVLVAGAGITGFGENLTGYAGVPLNNVEVATFFGPVGSDSSSVYTATISWGDGSATTTATITGSNGVFQASGGHTYVSSGTFYLQVNVSQADNSSFPSLLVFANAIIVPAPPAKIEILTPREMGKDPLLRVAGWDNAFELKNGKVQVKASFIDTDPNQFYIRVVDASANKDPKGFDIINVRMSTTSDRGNEILLNETGLNTGIFVSEGLLLTSFQIDDEYRADGIKDNTAGDRTFLVKLGDTVSATYGGITATAVVPTEKVVKLHINILRDKNLADGGMPVATQAQVEAWVSVTSKIYAQAGIRFVAAIQTVDPPPDVSVDGFHGYPGSKDDKYDMTPDEKNLLGDGNLRTEATDDIEVYYVTTFNGNFVGETLRESAVPDLKYADCIIIGAQTAIKNADYQVLSHEIGHILLDDPGHITSVIDKKVTLALVNLMASPSQYDGVVTDSRRISAVQRASILSKRPGLLTNP